MCDNLLEAAKNRLYSHRGIGLDTVAFLTRFVSKLLVLGVIPTSKEKIFYSLHIMFYYRYENYAVRKLVVCGAAK